MADYDYLMELCKKLDKKYREEAEAIQNWDVEPSDELNELYDEVEKCLPDIEEPIWNIDFLVFGGYLKMHISKCWYWQQDINEYGYVKDEEYYGG